MTVKKMSDKGKCVKKKKNIKKSEQKTSKKQLIYNVILVELVLVILVCGGALVHYKVQSEKSEKEFEQLKELIVYAIEDEKDSSVTGEGNGDLSEPVLETTEATQEQYVTIGGKSIRKEFERLYQLNSDLVGWITIDGTRIDYPVVQSKEDGEFYLNHNFAKEESKAGVIFVDERVNSQTGSNVIIYGHNMRAGTMFSDLMEYSKEDFYKEHKEISFDTIYAKGKYEVVAAFYTEAYADDDREHFNFYHYTDLRNRDVFDRYRENVSRLSLYDDTEYDYTDSFITLVTCSYHSDTGRFVVVAKKTE